MSGRERERGKLCIHWFTPQILATARAGPSQIQEPGTQSGFPIWVAGIKRLNYHLLPPRRTISRKLELKAELELEPGDFRMGGRHPT